jgi:hypothetical protein
MSGHRYKVGENVLWRPSRPSLSRGSREWTILRQLPIEDGGYLYRIKCRTETVERIAKESELSFPSRET